MMPTEEECLSCTLAVLGGITLNVCRELNNPELDCEKLASQFVDGEVSIQELLELVRKHTVDPEILGKLEEVETLAKGDR